MTRRVLVVDDDANMVETLCDVLELHGWETLRAFDGSSVERLVSEQPVDAVVMDVIMPRLNGVEALRAIKARHPDIPVILMTAYASHELLAQGERAGALRIVPKPLDPADLVSLLETTLRSRRPLLVVDDDPEYLRTLCDALASRGVRTVTARSLREALTQMVLASPRVVLLHLRVGPAELATGLQDIRRDAPSVTVVLYSGLPDALPHAAPLVDASFTKPIHLDELMGFLDGVARG